MWLMEERDSNMDEISQKKAKELFKKFTKKWNNKKLPQVNVDAKELTHCGLNKMAAILQATFLNACSTKHEPLSLNP